MKTFFIDLIREEKAQTSLEYIFLVAFVILMAAFIISVSTIVIDVVKKFGEHINFVEEKIAGLL